MADMTFEQIEDAAKNNIPVLFPIAVIEEHGPHMCLGTDAYLAYHLAKDVKRGLLDRKLESIIAPPYYWGITEAMSKFAGSFTVKPETMIAVLLDLLGCLKNWGFTQIFFINVHGDFGHNLAVTNAAKKAHEELELGAFSIVSDLFVKRAKLSGEEPFIIAFPMEIEQSSGYFDIHAGAFETGIMVEQFPDLVDLRKAQGLANSRTDFEGLKTWLQGGENARKVTPLGYLGDPSAMNIQVARKSNARTIDCIVDAIIIALRGAFQ
jgi:creatinine amidohydrolase